MQRIFKNITFCLCYRLFFSFCCFKVFSLLGKSYLRQVFFKRMQRQYQEETIYLIYCCTLRQYQEETIYLIFFEKIRNRLSFNVNLNQLGLEIPRMFLISLEHRILKNTPLYLWFAFSLQFCCLAVFSQVGKSIAISYILPRNIKHYTIWQRCHQVVSSRGNIFDIPQQNLKHGDTNNF